ncbi:virulence protein RhuM/Fic/DOC family protein [Rickettsiales endosymbiont of Trichoplax sp. H2]|uniref:virulence protein RhuM/Fic/DOC family protein n=1 Tax=Rickettsiales endosymbiont of Trichoplax sp. H2 TaxID=2021221 RepID=UPI0012B335E9|nr:virulence protein RhuM/Fic/DOC family protein [Rickettsiales endosymbiont of Trichoplax sp. H2]MSO14521.1 hypothetical protein [Rickettsiales endosymbiont of Trichoplax sp. H2]
MQKRDIQENLDKQKIILYQSESNEITLDIKLYDETLWLSLNQLSELFERDKSVISRHLKNIFDTEELEFDSTVANFATVQTEGNKQVTRDIDYYNLDAIISVGYRINSKRGTQFRKWSSKVLKEHLIKGYTINQQQLTQKSIKELQESIDLLSRTMINQGLTNEIGTEVLGVIKEYTSTWDTLRRFDEGRLTHDRGVTNTEVVTLNYKEAITAISSLKEELFYNKRGSNFFGEERNNSLKSILGNIEQTFGGELLYPSIHEKAANILYFIIKDHPFSDGNKRIGCLLFLMYLKKSNLNIKKIESNTLVALALLVAESKPSQKDLMIQLIIHLLQE